ncbi:hypothetical protein [Salipaludibacillus neizhouensis]|uniref:hypothetical protein n=1 Tax=Salipaludibacillus neizhouensis TaxID=885475 RepID=UPI0016044CE6|nr:hypothetical protein [Salipaludibacillus neizhouensis]
MAEFLPWDSINLKTTLSELDILDNKLQKGLIKLRPLNPQIKGRIVPLKGAISE